ncbi:hypothetical protein KNE206_18610 [Kitasatospora sp. NE20-6]|uniref:bifunctional DNA primase/polymerase n=1 Tax=Kitasatospora sp. NE20-6 TaxID=2859066 RepID=UPI0034DC9932
MRRSEDKRPLTAAGRAANSTDPQTWTTYDEAVRSTAGAGVGFVLNGDGVACIDLDHSVRPDGSLEPWAEAIVQAAGPTFVEVSVSGTGLHIFGYASVRQGRRIRRDGMSVEVYGTGRFIAVTGRRFADAPAVLADISELVADLMA